jgi:hypothetical protein
MEGERNKKKGIRAMKRRMRRRRKGETHCLIKKNSVNES